MTSAIDPQPVIPPGAATLGDVVVGGAVRHLAHSRRVLSLAGELAGAFRTDLVDVGHYALSVRNAAAWATLETAHELLTVGLRVGIAAGYRGHGPLLDHVADAVAPLLDRLARRCTARSAATPTAPAA